MSDIDSKDSGFGIGEVGKMKEPVTHEDYGDAELILCKCGHRVPRALVMWANLGTSCPDCYDRMSE